MAADIDWRLDVVEGVLLSSRLDLFIVGGKTVEEGRADYREFRGAKAQTSRMDGIHTTRLKYHFLPS